MNAACCIFTCLFVMTVFALTVISIEDDYFVPDDQSDIDDYNDEPSKKSSESERASGYSCGLCIVVDSQFAKAYKIKDPTLLKATIKKFIDHASWVFRVIDWNNNGRPDNIGFRVIKISYGWRPYKQETVVHYDTPQPAIQLLKIFARLDFSKCCLGVGFTLRPFTKGKDGIAFGASETLLGGICDHRNPHEDHMTNMNVVLISAKGPDKSKLTPSQIAISLVHELGHAFGVHLHDEDLTDYRCWGFRFGEVVGNGKGPVDGRYIMWGKSPQDPNALILRKNTLRFSHCSKTFVLKILRERKLRQRCFDLEYNPFCGNGIVEGAEMCDCGNEYDCSRQRCCGSRKSETPCMYDTKLCKIEKQQSYMMAPVSSAYAQNAPVALLIFVIFLMRLIG